MNSLTLRKIQAIDRIMSTHAPFCPNTFLSNLTFSLSFKSHIIKIKSQDQLQITLTIFIYRFQRINSCFSKYFTDLLQADRPNNLKTNKDASVC